MNLPRELHQRMLAALGSPEPPLPFCCVRLYTEEETPPPEVLAADPSPETVMCCQAVRHAIQGEPVWLTAANVGCVAAGISLGLVDEHQREPLEGPRVYTCIMREQAGLTPEEFVPPSPEDFTTGVVYACRAAGRPQYGLFGPEDSGRFRDVETARRAVSSMAAIQPPVMQGVYFYPPDREGPELLPQVVVLAVRPVELTRLLQGYQYVTGERVDASLGPVRAVDSDLIARPFLTGRINLSTFCLGARVVAGFAGDRMGLGLPWHCFQTMVEGLEESRTGYPYERYPGAQE
ncbi:MAG: DUF169 domain-containing protein [Deltaproteobacteria bacterium]|nr:DUF169 domain-containing protein [Deltaproteobacteria bacterium]